LQTEKASTTDDDFLQALRLHDERPGRDAFKFEAGQLDPADHVDDVKSIERKVS